MNVKELRTILKTLKYPEMVVEKGIEKALAIPQDQLRSEKVKNNDDILREIYGNFQASKILDEIFAKDKVIDCERQPSNLKRPLWFSNFSTNFNKNQLSSDKMRKKITFVVIM